LAAVNALADQVAHLALSVNHHLDQVDERLARIEQRASSGPGEESGMRPYDWVHTCPNCSAGWVLDDSNTAHRCQECNH
jgi:hypothetical protein